MLLPDNIANDNAMVEEADRAAVRQGLRLAKYLTGEVPALQAGLTLLELTGAVDWGADADPRMSLGGALSLDCGGGALGPFKPGILVSMVCGQKTFHDSPSINANSARGVGNVSGRLIGIFAKQLQKGALYPPLWDMEPGQLRDYGPTVGTTVSWPRVPPSLITPPRPWTDPDDLPIGKMYPQPKPWPLPRPRPQPDGRAQGREAGYTLPGFRPAAAPEPWVPVPGIVVIPVPVVSPMPVPNVEIWPTPGKTSPPAGRKPPTRTKKQMKKLHLQVVGTARTVWDFATEASDAVWAVYSALPRGVRNYGRDRGLHQKALTIALHVADIDTKKAMTALASNEVQDRVWGTIGRLMGLAQRRLGVSGVQTLSGQVRKLQHVKKGQ